MYFIFIFLIMLLNFCNVPYTSEYEEKVESSFNMNEYYSPKEVIKIDEILEDKSGSLSEQEKEALIELKDKLNSYQALSQAIFLFFAANLSFLFQSSASVSKKRRL